MRDNDLKKTSPTMSPLATVGKPQTVGTKNSMMENKE